ncbi:MAG: hypothetical protein RL420_1367, partial [Pseudomonadota bacterium]
MDVSSMAVYGYLQCRMHLSFRLFLRSVLVVLTLLLALPVLTVL